MKVRDNYQVSGKQWERMRQGDEMKGEESRLFSRGDVRDFGARAWFIHRSNMFDRIYPFNVLGVFIFLYKS